MLWGTAAPPSARVTVQNNVARLRKALGDDDRARIGTQPRGYVISVADGELDMNRFEALLGTARQAARSGSWDTAAADSRAALALWRGEPLADVESELLAVREVPRLADLRLQAVETRIEADLHLGRHAEVTGELRQLTAVHPLRDHLHALLMLALYRAGRQAEALTAYQAARRVLIEELGTEPGPELRSLHQQILVADPALDLSGSRRAVGPRRAGAHRPAG
jgi:DNA-binding SARP family transcriptional activator